MNIAEYEWVVYRCTLTFPLLGNKNWRKNGFIQYLWKYIQLLAFMKNYSSYTINTQDINSQIINRVIPLTRKNYLLLFFIKSKKYFLPNPIVWKQFMEKIAKCKKVATMRMRSAKTDWQRRFLTFVSSIFVTFRWDTCDL